MSDYEKDLTIDKDNLDNCFIQQPILAMKYQEEYAKVQRKRDDLKLELEVLEAEIDREIRDNSVKKPTESEIKNSVLMDKKRIKLVKEFNEVTEKVNILKGAVNSFEHKKKSLEKLTELFLAGYFSAVKQTNVEKEIKQKVTRKKLREKL